MIEPIGTGVTTSLICKVSWVKRKLETLYYLKLQRSLKPEIKRAIVSVPLFTEHGTLKDRKASPATSVSRRDGRKK